MKLIYSDFLDESKIDIYVDYSKSIKIYLDNIETLNSDLDDFFKDKFEKYNFIIRFYQRGLYCNDFEFFMKNFCVTKNQKSLKMFIEKTQEMFQTYDYFDNFRFCVKGSDLESIYSFRRSKGCCGFYDEIVDYNNQEIMIGFNFGH